MLIRRLFPPMRGLCCLVAAALALAATGCGKSVGNISGKVTYQDKALTGGYVNFSCEGDAPTVKTSIIKEDGGYSIIGMPVGPAKISVQGIPAPQGPGAGGTTPPTGGRKVVYVPPQYSTTENSGLTYTVVSGSQTHDIPLK
jgi:hypothetical protein